MELIKELFKVSSKKEDSKPFFKTGGEASFELEVNVVGNAPFSSCILSVTSLARSKQHKIVIGTQCRWFRSYLSQDIPIKGSGNSYRVSALDIGAKIKVLIVPTDPDESGQASVVFGPIQMDDMQKSSLRRAINSEGSPFPFDSISPFDIDEGLHGGRLVVFESFIKITLADNEDRDFKVYFGENFDLSQGTEERSLVFTFADNLKVQAMMDFFLMRKNERSDKLTIKFPSQNTRDIFVILLKTFEGITELKDKIILRRALETAAQGLADRHPQSISTEEISTQLDSTSLERELCLLSKTHKQVGSEKDRLSSMVSNLEGEISRTQYCSIG